MEALVHGIWSSSVTGLFCSLTGEGELGQTQADPSKGHEAIRGGHGHVHVNSLLYIIQVYTNNPNILVDYVPSGGCIDTEARR